MRFFRFRIKTVSLCLLLALLFGCAFVPREAATGTPPPAPQETTVPTEAPTATPEPTETPTEAPTEAPTATPTPSPTPVPEPFGLAWLPDTQKLTATDKEERLQLLDTLGGEIVSRIGPDRLIGVLHSGDIVDYGNRTQQWANFDRCLNAFVDRIPFYPVSGNHDVGKYDSVNGGSYHWYLQQPFLKRLPEGQTYEDGKMFYALLGDWETPLLLLGLGYDMGRQKPQREWIDAVLEAHADLPCIVLTHAYETRPGNILWYCRDIERYVIRPHPNVRMLLCGHARGFFADAASFDDDGDGTAERTVNILMLDNQEGVFLWRILLFDPVTHAVTVRTRAIGSDEPVPDDPAFGCPGDFTIEDAF